MKLSSELIHSMDHAECCTLLKVLPVILWGIDATGKITLSEGAELATLGFKPGELVGRNVFDLYADNQKVCADIRKGLYGVTFNALYEIAPDTWFRTYHHPLYNGGDEVLGLIGVSLAADPEHDTIRYTRELRKLLYD